MKKIDIYKNGEYIFSTRRYKTIKEAVACTKSQKTITVASIPDKIVEIGENDKITGKFDNS